MSSQAAGKRFRIERLEERIAPGIVFFGIGWDSVGMTGELASVDATGRGIMNPLESVAAFSAFIGGPASQSFASPSLVTETCGGHSAFAGDSSNVGDVTHRHAVMPRWAEELLGEIQRRFDQDVNQPATIRSGIATENGPVMPPWAEELLGDIQRRFDEVEASMPRAVDADVTAQVRNEDDVLTTIGRDFSQPTTRSSWGTAETHAVMPPWAADFLGQIERQFDKVSIPGQHVGPVDEVLSKITSEFGQPTTHSSRVAPECQSVMPSWADNFLGEIQRQFDKNRTPNSGLAGLAESRSLTTV